MYRACELKDQTYKKTRTLHFLKHEKITKKKQRLGYRWPSTGVKKAFSLENSEKSVKRGCRGLSAPGSTYPPKKSKTSQKPEKNLKNSHFRLFFEPFWTPGPRGPANPFSDFFRSLPGKGLLAPVDGQRYPKTTREIFETNLLEGH